MLHLVTVLIEILCIHVALGFCYFECFMYITFPHHQFLAFFVHRMITWPNLFHMYPQSQQVYLCPLKPK